jgi:Rap1a immunity proteins
LGKAKSGTEFMSVCSGVVGGGSDPQHMQNEATCLGWVEGFADGFTVHDELLGVPRADRMVCISRNVTNAQMIRAITKYIGSNPDKAHRATRLVASVALAQAFPCRRAK